MLRTFSSLRAGRPAGGLRGGRSDIITTALGKGLRAVRRDHPLAGRRDRRASTPRKNSWRTDAVVAERKRVTATLRDAGFTVPPSRANFIWLPLAERTGLRGARPQTRIVVQAVR